MELDDIYSQLDGENDIAIIGMAGRFPGAGDVETFWRNVRDGKESITTFSDEELLRAGITPEQLRDPNYVKAGAILEDIDLLDAAFFGLTPKEAQIMDPQQRLFLETAWNALEGAGYNPETYSGAIGLYAGCGLSTYLLNNLYPHSDLADSVGTIPIVLGNDKDSLTTRVAYLLNLTGPCYTVQTYCSTSLVAVCIACSSLLGGECDMALAGGVAISVPQRAGYLYQEGGIASPDGHCRAFDAKALGAPLGSGVAVVVLKRLGDALRAGDTIHALIKGTAINNDGALKVGYTAPGIRGQASVIAEAIANAGVEPESIRYIEAHGTGTPLGDAVELAALVKAFEGQTTSKGFCAIGSVKTNIGHLDRAAGVTGLIKTVMALKHRQLPPSLNYEEPNPQFQFQESPFYVNTTLQPWPISNSIPRRAGVSAFGLGGTNAHVVVEEAPTIPSSNTVRGPRLLLLSARSEAALEAATTNLQHHLQRTPEVNLADVAYTLQVGRKAFDYRRMLVCSDVSDAIDMLERRDTSCLISRQRGGSERPVIFLFPGVGEQEVDMARGLYEHEPFFRAQFDRCAEILSPLLGFDPRELLYPSESAQSFATSRGTLTAQQVLQQTRQAQPVTFALEYALAQLLIHWGVKPQALLGYSLGEYVAACLAGVFSLEDALRLVATRARLIQQAPPGAMTAILLPVEKVSLLLEGIASVSLAATNSALQCVVSGTEEGIEELEARLREQAIAYQRLATSHPFHCELLAPYQQALEEQVRQLSYQQPELPYLSNVTGDWITPEQATDAHYWSRHLCEPVRFAEALDTLAKTEQEWLLVEVGPGQWLSSCARQQMMARQMEGDHKESDLRELPLQRDRDTSQARSSGGRPGTIAWETISLLASRDRRTALSLLQGQQRSDQDEYAFWSALGRLWLAGIDVNWSVAYTDSGERRQRLPLPTYPFERQRYWIDPPQQQAPSPVKSSPQSKKPDIANWFYTPAWRRAELEHDEIAHPQAPWLVFVDDTGLGVQLVERLQSEQLPVVTVHPGNVFARRDKHTFSLRPQQRADYDLLLNTLKTEGLTPRTSIHCWGMADSTTQALVLDQVEPNLQGFYSLLFLAQALIAVSGEQDSRLYVLTNGAQAVTGQEQLSPIQATMTGACRVIAQESFTIACRSIDLALTESEPDHHLLDALLAECTVPAQDLEVAYRNGQRWVRAFEPLRLAPMQGDRPALLRQRGVYLITGGLGHVGLILAEYLAHTIQARLVLVSRSTLPPREQWQRRVEQHEESDRTSACLQRLLMLEALGAEILPIAADVADEQQMRNVVEQTYARFGTLNGIFHAAGVTDPQAFVTIAESGLEACSWHFRPKIHGILALERALQGRELDFRFFFSSLSAVLGGLGFVAYAAANSFLDHYAQLRNREGTSRWLSINWDTWQSETGNEGGLGQTVAAYAMTPEEGIEALARVLSTPPTTAHLVNSTGDLHARIRQWLSLENLQSTASGDDSQQAVVKSQPTSTTPLNRTNYEQRIIEIWQQALGISHIGPNDNFFELGGNSLIGLQVLARIKKEFNVQIPAVALFEAPTINAIARYLQPEQNTQETQQHEQLARRRTAARQTTGSQEIAIIGMAGRFPGAESLEQFWHNLRNGIESISFFSDDELLAAGVDPALLREPNYVKARPVLEHVDLFDAGFFGYSPREAELMDPQHRLFLECSWEALEHAGYDPQTYEGLIGVFGGTNISTYMLSLARNLEAVGIVNDYQAVISNDKDSLATTVSYKFDLRGPSFAVQTFCSTSLVAAHLACQSLRNGECDIALAGGVSIRVPSITGHLYQEGGMESPDGHCRTFDAQARGSMFGDGVGLVVLKRLSDALEDGDTIHAVIKGSAINNDGSLKVSYTAPSVIGQSDVVAAALENAGVTADTISYIEAHGTATELGDPVEVTALTRAFRRQTQRTQYCAIGSVKTNMGHLDRAAGISGLLKTVLALKHRELPPSLHYETPNPEIDFEHSPFYVNAQLAEWRTDNLPRRAGINSLGMGGTNAHVVVEEAPEREPSGQSRRWQLLLFSAATETALETMTLRLHDYLQTHPEVPLADIAYTLQVGRKRFSHRRMLLCRTHDEAIKHLAEPANVLTQTNLAATERPVAFLFPGVGEQYTGMAQRLYEHEPYFRQIVDRCCVMLKELLAVDLRTILYPANRETAQEASPDLDLRAMLGRAPTPDATQAQLKRTVMAQPLVFIIEYALARLLMRWGIVPQAMLGYSLGEYVAACIAGVLSLEDALMLVARRAQLIEEAPPGALVAVVLSEAEAQQWTSHEVSLTAINGPRICVLGGAPEAIERLESQLAAREITFRRVETTHAFHCHLLKPLAERFTELARQVSLHAPAIPYISNLSGTWVTAEQATDPIYWTRHMCEPVRFSAGIQQLVSGNEMVLVEVGPGLSLGSFVKQQVGPGTQVISSLPTRYERQEADAFLHSALGKLWLAGVKIAWSRFYADEIRRRVPLPTYPFERQRYWIDAQTPVYPQSVVSALTTNSEHAPAAILSQLERKELVDWFYVPGWTRSVSASGGVVAQALRERRHWLIFLDEEKSNGPGWQLAAQLQSYDQDVITVVPGEEFVELGPTSYRIRPGQRADYARLLRALRTHDALPDHVLHLWLVTTGKTEGNLEHLLTRGFSSLLFLVQALGELTIENCQLSVIANNLYRVLGTEMVVPEKATLLGPCRVIPLEYPGMRCLSIDIDLSSSGSEAEQMLVTNLLAEVALHKETTSTIALRNGYRWLPAFEPLKLDEQVERAVPLRQHGTYLITGGLGGIGLALAEHLACTLHARLVLVGRSGLPPRQEWPAICAARGDTDRQVEQIRSVERMEQLGAEVLSIAADVTHEGQMREAIEQANAAFGPLNGIIHAAGVPGIGLMQLKTVDMAMDVMAPKVQGTLVLDRIARDLSLDFLALFSSITSITGGGPGQVDYCAANNFLDAFAYHHATDHGRTIAIDWGEWQWNAWEQGLAGYDTTTQTFFKENRQRFGISFAEGARAFERILTAQSPQIVVSTQDFRTIVELSSSFTIATVLRGGALDQSPRPLHARPTLAIPYVAPRTDLEQQIATIWSEALGLAEVGIHDNFFELGGNSLVGIDLITRLRTTLHAETVPTYVLYECPTIASMAQFFSQEQSTAVVAEREERGEKRREHLKMRMRGVHSK